ncbi:MAG TPA: HlyD family efflux transporter periplasmic adaptor subunit, partial [Anaerolineales bacterium]|nr:HlyD family efflux transporter periplasmic adaptor subunit [Anaerolineales bacterium]
SMNHKLPQPVIAIIVLAVIAALYFGLSNLNSSGNGELTASGSIEATIVNISSELAGKILEVDVEEGMLVHMDDAILHLDPSLLSAQRAVASAQADSARAALNTAQSAYETAQQQYNTALSTALASEKATRTTFWKDLKPSEFDQPVWFFSKEERLKAAQAQVDSTAKALQLALDNLETVQKKAGNADFLDIEAALIQARVALQNAQNVFDATSGASESQTLRDAAQVILDEAKIDIDEAQKDYDDALSTDDAKDVLEARADAAIAQEIYNNAVDLLRALQTGANSPSVLTAGKAVEQAEAALEQAQANLSTAQASLALLDTQVKKLTVYAPMDGVVLTRNVEPGEFVQPGAVALTVANLNELTITVYVPDPRLNEISVGQKATVAIDVASGESPTFSAEVLHISDQAEFTPRNVQTVEGRSSTVFAVKLKVTNIEGKLKIGMPADVLFK